MLVNCISVFLTTNSFKTVCLLQQFVHGVRVDGGRLEKIIQSDEFVRLVHRIDAVGNIAP